MKALDRYLQNVRIKKASRFIRKNDVVLDIGSADGVMFEQLSDVISYGIGVDPTLTDKITKDKYELIPGYFPDVCPKNLTYDCITMLAVLEHIPTNLQKQLAQHCFELLNEKGRVIITVPSPQVDYVLAVLTKLKLVDGMSLEEHYGFEANQTPQIFGSTQFKLIHREQFQLGLNNCFVFEKI